MNNTPDTVATPQGVLDSLARTAPALAHVDADGVLLWCSVRFVALFPTPTGPDQRLHELLSASAAAELARGEVGG